jgi:hypothetical protein
MSTISLMSKAKLTQTVEVIDKREVFCPCKEVFENVRAYLQHKKHCKVHTELQIATPNSKRKPRKTALNMPNAASSPKSANSATGSVTATRNPTSKVLATKKDKQCPCGERFTNDMQLASHLRYSATHRRKSASAPNVKSVALQSLPPPSAREKTTDASLVASLAGLKLNSVEVRAKPSVGPYSCRCGDGFASQAALDRHRQLMGRCAWPEGGEIKDKKFKTPRPQYQKDGYLEESVALLKLQYARVT